MIPEQRTTVSSPERDMNPENENEYFDMTLDPLPSIFHVYVCMCVLAMYSLLSRPLLTVWSWAFRYIHIALDTIVLYGALGERIMDERGDSTLTGSSG